MENVSDHSVRTISNYDSLSQSSDQNSHRKSSSDSNIETRVCLVGSISKKEDLIQALLKIKEMEVLVLEILPHFGGKRKYKHSTVNMEIDVPYLFSKDGHEYADNEDPLFETIFVLAEFEGNIFNDLKCSENRILGPPIIYHIAETKEALPYTHRPLYCNCMQNLNLCFSNFKTKAHLTRLVSLCHYMGACIRKEMSAKIDFLVTNSPHGPKYRTAVSLGIPVVKEDWIHLAWAARDSKKMYQASDLEFVQPSKAKPLEGCIISFLGFSDEECKHMQDQAVQQGGTVDEVGSLKCTHLVVDESNIKVLPFLPQGRLLIVVQEWFWGSIQIEARAAESMYLFEKSPNPLTRSATCTSLLGGSTPVRKGSTLLRNSSSIKNRKRSRRREDTLAKIAQDIDEDQTKQPPNKRLSTGTSICISESLLDISNNVSVSRTPQTDKRRVSERKRRLTIASEPSALERPCIPRPRRCSAIPENISVKIEEPCLEDSLAINNSTTRPVAGSARYQVAMELLQTENNYIGILNTIINVFKKPLEDPKQAGGPILAPEDVKSIFGSLAEIHSVHAQMTTDLEVVMKQWNEKSCIGCVVKKYAPEFVRCYPMFVNFFDTSKKTISTCEAKFPRFHAFLKINQAKKECGRQTLAELLINPVQRLPRIILLLQDIKKHTERENAKHPDVEGIKLCIDEVKEVMTHINEDRRKTESQKQIFDIVYEVEGCPPTIVSSHRQFITRAELLAVDENLCAKGDHVSLILFSDCIEIAKKKKGVKNTHKSPNVHAINNSAVRNLKHVKLISLSHVKKVVDIQNSEDCQSAFSLYCRTPTDTKDWLYTFRMISCQGVSQQQTDDQSNTSGVLPSDEGKSTLLKLLSRHRANTVCKASDDNFIYSVASHELDISTTDAVSTIGRAVRAAKKSSKKLTRAFSFSRTPRRVVQRAMTNVMTPSPVSLKTLSNNEINPALGATPSRSNRGKNWESENEDNISLCSESGLTPSMSVASLCTPQRTTRSRIESTLSLQSQKDEDEENIVAMYRSMKPSASTLTLHRNVKPARATVEFPAMPTPPVRRKKNAIKAATISLGRSASFRRKHKLETKL